MVGLLGSRDVNLRALEDGLAADVHVRGNRITLRGAAADVALAERSVRELLSLQEGGALLTPDAVRRTIGMLSTPASTAGAAAGESPSQVLGLNIVSRRGRTIRPKTVNQKRYVDAIDENTIVFGIGPAGTGKTYLAMAKAVQALQAKQITRIILTRPAVEAGERLGYLPGTLSDKIDPYLRPLYDALHDMLDPESIPRLMAAGTIEVAPLAYMRGRAQPYDAKVLTPEGFRPIGSLQVGDLVIGSNGEPTPVLGVYPQGEREVYRVTAQDGSSTIACGEHLWTVRTPEDKRRGRSRTLTTADMIGNLRRGYVRRYELPMMAPAQQVAQPVPMDPYALGLLLGDGCITTSTTPSFATNDPELAVALQDALEPLDVQVTHKADDDWVLRNRNGARAGLRLANPVTAIVRELGLAGARSATKFVPECYLQNSAQVRLAVLQGLLDTDGGPVTQIARSCRVQYTTTSPRLADDVEYLVRSLGGVSYRRVRKAEGRKPGLANGRPVGYLHDAHLLDIRLPSGVAPFRLARKTALYERSGGGRPMRFVDRIEPLGVMDTLCIQVAAEDSLYVTDDFLVTHNTLNDAFIILDEAQNTTPEQMKMFLTRLGFGSKIVVTGDVTQVDLPGGQRSGLQVVREILEDIDDVHFSTLTSADVVRHQLVGAIVDAYAKWDDRQPPPGQGPGGERQNRFYGRGQQQHRGGAR
ncbi:phosphate starvation-inducible protein PhoH [Nakamurella sp. YIM 132087]|uniref:PhoH-like protein n=1 Tax=Nakamurella alba TaxID=2665158 RepID=A0A7K1FGJ4_9ACTN|nr:phosphate starvation-inducible protein PhoH [Nakamurella alba]